MQDNNKLKLKYSAKYSYQSGLTREKYEKERFTGFIGRYRYIREQKAIASIIELLPMGISVADCPCGNGRWWPALAQRANYIIAVDVSKGMVKIARNEAQRLNIKIEVREGDAENLNLADECVDYAFSHALTKHLPIPTQYQVLSEFSRISRRGVICSFGIFSHLTYEFWRLRNLSESYPTFLEELEWMAKAAGLKINKKRKCTTPLGVEHTLLFDKL